VESVGKVWMEADEPRCVLLDNVGSTRGGDGCLGEALGKSTNSG
jgi:hypothetical protein